MDKIREIVEGVQILAPGIIVGLIFYMYSEVKFDQFGFLLFCAVSVIFVSLLTDALIAALAFLRVQPIARAIRRTETLEGQPQAVPTVQLRAVARAQLEWARLPSQFMVAFILGILVINLYQNDSFYKLLSPLVASPKVTLQDTNDRVLRWIAKKEFDYVDRRPPKNRACQVSAPDCSRDVYLRTKTKHGDLYEGAPRYYPMKLEVQGFYLSPACASRLQDKAWQPLEKLSGPGVYVSIADAAAIEYVDAISSECFKLYYPSLWKPLP